MNLHIAGLSFSYPSVPILKEIDFDFEQQEVVGILGPNGTGKTTMLRCINRILEPESGHVFLGERDLAQCRRSELARTFGYVAQRAESARTTVFDTVLIGRRPHIRWTLRDADIEATWDVLNKLDLQSMALRPVHELSGGEYQKVRIARALVQEPRVILLDEPTASLDLKNALEIMEILRDLSRTRRILVLMTIHDINLALGAADRLILLKAGSLYSAIRPGEITSDLVEAIYGVSAEIVTNGGRPYVLPESIRREEEDNIA